MDRNECFKILVKEMHKYIKMRHHLYNLREPEEEPGPRSLVAGSGGSASSPNTNHGLETFWECQKMAQREPRHP